MYLTFYVFQSCFRAIAVILVSEFFSFVSVVVVVVDVLFIFPPFRIRIILMYASGRPFTVWLRPDITALVDWA